MRTEQEWKNLEAERDKFAECCGSFKRDLIEKLTQQRKKSARLEAENASLRKRLEKAEKDADRYQFLRFADLDAIADDNWRDSEVWTGDKFDAAIDAAIKAQKEGKS